MALALAWGTACAGTPPPTVSSEPAVDPADDPIPDSGRVHEPRRPDAELQALGQCSERMMSILGRSSSERGQAIAENQGALAQCGELFFSRCGAPSADHDDPAILAQTSFHSCLERYCPRWAADQRPALCEDQELSAFVSSDREHARAQAQTFIAAMLAADYGRPAHDPTIERVAGHFAALWTLSAATSFVALPPADPEPPIDPLELHVELSAKGGVVIIGTGIEPIELPPGDLEGLRREAEALKRRHPEASMVSIAPDEDVKMEELLQVMGVLQGECSAGPNDPRCLFPRVVLMVRDPDGNDGPEGL